MAKRPILLAIESDLHGGSTVAPCPPKVRLDDGGIYEASPLQNWLREQRESYWKAIAALRQAHKADLWYICVGDATEGNHHNSTQAVSGNPEAQAYILDQLMKPMLALSPSRKFIIRGTEAHVGPSGASEEALARTIKAERDTSSGNWSWWELDLDVHGTRHHFAHHGKVGGRINIRRNVVMASAWELFDEYASRGWRHPDVAWRGHRHLFADSHDAAPVRVIQTPAWQAKTAFAYKVAANNISDMGAMSCLVMPDGTMTIRKHLYTPAQNEAR